MSSGEDDLIARYFRPVATAPGALGLVDDAAVLQPAGDDIVVTADAIVAGVHFLPDDPPDTVARKALRVNLSDLAAKGATPAGFVLTLALREVSESWLAPFARALGDDAVHFDCPLLGGDTVSTPGPLTVSITAFGRVPPGRMVRRSTAKPGDHVMVSGSIGDAVLGLAILKGASSGAGEDARAALADRYRVPQPRVTLALAVRDHASAAMDVSDGLMGDLAKLCAASGVSAAIEAAAVPLSPSARGWLQRDSAAIGMLVSGGDDYEILCTVPDHRLAAFEAAAEETGTSVSRIGRIVSGKAPPKLLDARQQEIALARLSYSHF